jgi:hypothetical protein
MNTQNKSDPPLRKFGWFGLRDKMRIFKQMYQFHSTLDVEVALRAELWKGMGIGRNRRIPVEPFCDLHNDPEFDQPLVCIAPGIFVCQLCRSFTSFPVSVARPTIKLVPDVERQTGPIIRERPAIANIRKWHPDDEAGPRTNEHRAIRKRNTVNLALEDVPTQELKRGKV